MYIFKQTKKNWTPSSTAMDEGGKLAQSPKNVIEPGSKVFILILAVN